MLFEYVVGLEYGSHRVDLLFGGIVNGSVHFAMALDVGGCIGSDDTASD